MAKIPAQASKDKMRNKRQQDLSFTANNIVKAMLNNPAYISMQPTVIVLQQQAVIYANCLTKIKEKSKKATQEKNTAKELLLQTLFWLINEINFEVNKFGEKEYNKDPDADVNYILNAGFELREPRHKKGKETPATPIIQSLKPTDKAGTIAVDLLLDEENIIKLTVMCISYDNGETYEKDPKYLVDSKGEISGLRSTSIALVAFASVGANGIASEWTVGRKVAIL